MRPGKIRERKLRVPSQELGVKNIAGTRLGCASSWHGRRTRLLRNGATAQEQRELTARMTLGAGQRRASDNGTGSSSGVRRAGTRPFEQPGDQQVVEDVDRVRRLRRELDPAAGRRDQLLRQAEQRKGASKRRPERHAQVEGVPRTRESFAPQTTDALTGRGCRAPGSRLHPKQRTHPSVALAGAPWPKHRWVSFRRSRPRRVASVASAALPCSTQLGLLHGLLGHFTSLSMPRSRPQHLASRRPGEG